MDDTHVVSQIKTGPTPSELSEWQQRTRKTRGFNKGVGLTLSHAKTICCIKPRKNRQHSGPTISFSLVPSASVTSLYRATEAFTEKAAGLRGRFLMECQGDLKGGSHHIVLMYPPAHPHIAISNSPHDPVSVFHSCCYCCYNRWTDGHGTPLHLLSENNYLPQSQSHGLFP